MIAIRISDLAISQCVPTQHLPRECSVATFSWRVATASSVNIDPSLFSGKSDAAQVTEFDRFDRFEVTYVLAADPNRRYSSEAISTWPPGKIGAQDLGR